jgi:CrcB protein
MIPIVLVLIGGGLGALLRYGTTLMCVRWFGAGFPWGTLMVNLAGCFLIGVIFALAERTQLIGPHGRLFLMTGFLGGLTTFSTYGLESVVALRGGDYSTTLANILVNNVGGLILVVAGVRAARLFI